ncbi:hypothetical protein ACYSNR_00475 [Enterococcus sp. LJL128]
MKNHKVLSIRADGYERWIHLINDNLEKEIVAHFIEYEEYLETDMESQRYIGDELIGELKINLVTNYERVIEKQSSFVQTIEDSSSITTIAKVEKVLDEDSLLCSVQGLSDELTIDFENDVSIDVGTFIKVEGALEIEI